jgi:hypothetical protein
MESFEQRLQRQFEMQKALFLTEMRNILDWMVRLQSVNALDAKVAEKKEELDALVQFVQENPSQRNEMYQRTRRIGQSIAGDERVSNFSKLTFEDPSHVLCVILNFCQALRPFQSVETYTQTLIVGEVFSKIERSFGESNSEKQKQEMQWVRDVIARITREENESHRTQLLYWLRVAFQKQDEYQWITPDVKKRFFDLLPPDDVSSGDDESRF